MARMITTLAVVVGLLLTLVLPIYPEGLEPTIVVFLGLAFVGAMFGLAQRSARYELAIMAPWAAAILLGILVGSVHNGESQQAVEDALPYALFVLGLVAGRGIGSPRLALRVGLLVCVVDAIVSLYLMDDFGPGMRSTFNYFKITAGLPLVGLYLAAVLRETSAPGERRHWMVHAAIILLLVVGIVLSVSRGMLLGWLLGLAIATYVRKPSQALLGVTAVLVGMLLWSSAFAEVGVEYLRLGQEETITGRFREVEAAWDGFVAAPMFGEGLGALVEVDGFRKAFVHNMAAYHLWKFGLVGCVLLLLPLFAIGRELRRSPRRLRALAIGAAAGIIGYLVTCAAYKTYYLVWIYGIVIGTSLTYFGELARAKAARERDREVAPPEPASA
jgi:hypothetical protein